MKALMCVCGQLHTPPEDRTWSFCRCGQAACRWENAHAGRFDVWARDLSMVRVLGLHNGMIEAVFLHGLRGVRDVDNAAFQAMHKELGNSRGYLFDSSRRGCWATFVAAGETGDITWSDGPEPTAGEE